MLSFLTWRRPAYGSWTAFLQARSRFQSDEPVAGTSTTSSSTGPGVLDRTDRTRLVGLPVTSATRTLIDLAAVADSGVLESAVEAALRRRLTSPFLLQSRLDALGARHRPGVGHLRRILHQRPVGGPSESELETMFVRILRDNRVPLPRRQHEIRSSGGRLIGRTDLAYPAHKLLIELDGWNVHRHQDTFEADLERQNALIRAGWKPLRFTWARLVGHSHQVVAELRELLAS